MKFINLTPHTLNVHCVDGSVMELAPSGQVARVRQVSAPSVSLHGVQFYKTTYSDVEGLPDPVDGQVYIVSGMVEATLPGRPDVVAPGDLRRDGEGRPIGCEGLRKTF
jgi:hypothetical protein